MRNKMGQECTKIYYLKFKTLYKSNKEILQAQQRCRCPLSDNNKLKINKQTNFKTRQLVPYINRNRLRITINQVSESARVLHEIMSRMWTILLRVMEIRFRNQIKLHLIKS